MRLIAALIKADQKEHIAVCDLACGHGGFLRELKCNRIECYGVDGSVERCQALNSMGIECRLGFLESSGYGDEMFDYVTMMECLEHVADPFIALREAYRILKEEGQVFVTVPYGTNCDFDTHVRQFYEDDLYVVAADCGYTDIRIMRSPYINSSLLDNLVMSARKKYRR